MAMASAVIAGLMRRLTLLLLPFMEKQVPIIHEQVGSRTMVFESEVHLDSFVEERVGICNLSL